MFRGLHMYEEATAWGATQASDAGAGRSASTGDVSAALSRLVKASADRPYESCSLK